MATVQRSTTSRNSALDSFETAVGASPKLRIYSGTLPANCAAAATGTMLCDMTLPADWLAAAASGVKSKSGTWSGTGDAGAGAGTNAGYYRIWDSTVTTAHEQGDITATAGGGAMTLDNISIASGQTVTVNTYSITAWGA